MRGTGVDGRSRKEGSQDGSESDESLDEVSVDDNDDDDDYMSPNASDDVSAGKTKLELKNSALKDRIAKLEAQNLAPKSWQMTGEIAGKERPQNALLEEHLGYESATRMAPLITEDFTEKLENVIVQRIKDKAWDDVERKLKPVQDPRTYRNELVLDQEKSKISLSQVYEEEFLKQSRKEKADASNPKHQEIEKDMRSLFDKLDALSNYHYVPKPPTAEIKVVKNIRSLEMEEVAPVSLTEGALLTAEEVMGGSGGELKDRSERDSTDRKRERRKKKDLKRKKEALREARESKAPGVPKDKIKALEKVGKVKKAKRSVAGNKSMKSTEFFNKMQKEVSDKIKVASLNLSGHQSKKKTRGAAEFKL